VLGIACFCSKYDVAQLLLDGGGVDPWGQDNGRTVFDHAAVHATEDVLSLFFGKNPTKARLLDAMHVASGAGNIAFLSVVRARSALWDQVRDETARLFSSAIQNGRTRFVQELCKADGLSNLGIALPWAAARGNMEAVSALLGARAEVTFDALSEAVRKKRTYILEELLRFVSPTQCGDDTGTTTVLHLLAAGGSDFGPEILKLATAKAKMADLLDTKNSLGNTPLHIAIYHKNDALVEALLRHGASVQIANDESLMPLHIAAAKGHLEIVKIVVEAGAQLGQRVGKKRGP
jgi:ankyrin repeat protein